MSEDSDDTTELIDRVIRHDEHALAELFSRHRNRLWKIVNFRLDHRLRGRVDADDILQESYLNTVKRLKFFLHDASRSIFVWFRLIVSQTLIDVHRRHLGAQMRDASRDFSVDTGWTSESTSFSLSFHLLGHLTSPSVAALRAELSDQLKTAINSMNKTDREVLALRHFEELTNTETSHVLSMSEQAASLRYVRALAKLKKIMSAIPGFLDG